MKAGELIKYLTILDDSGEIKKISPDADIRVCTVDRLDLEIFSIYEDNGVVYIDVGEDGDDEKHAKRNPYL